MKVLITGASGFIGTRVLEQLIKGNNDVVALSSSVIPDIKTIDAAGYTFDNDYLEKLCPDVEIILHIGAFTPKDNSEANDESKSTGNIVSTQKLIDAAGLLTNLKKLIYISTLDVYVIANEPITENTNTVPHTVYGWSKLYCEKIISTWAEKHSIQYEILRLGHVYGEREEKYRKVMPVMIEKAVTGNDITIYGDGNAIRSYIYIEDVAKAIVNSLDLKDSQIINIVGNEPVTINELSEMIINMSGADINVKHINSDIQNRNLIFDNSKLMNMLLDELTPLSVGLKREIEYFKEKICEYNI